MDSKIYSRTEPMLLPYYPRLIHQSMQELGFSSDALFKGVGVSAENLEDETFRLTIEQHERFVLRALEISKDPHLAIRLARIQDNSKANLALMAAASSGDIAKALHLIVRYNRIVTRVFSIRSIDTDDEKALELDSYLEHDSVMYFAIGAFALFLDKFFREGLAGAHLVHGVDVSFSMPKGFRERSAEYPFPIRFDCPHNRVYLNADLLVQPLYKADPQTTRLLIEMCDQQLEEADAERGIVGAVKSVVVGNIASPPKLDDAARMLGVSSRGLRRKLAESGTSYKKILDSLRVRMATKLLRETEVPISSIAYELGFSNPSDFGRSFKRCSGVSPSAIRAHK